MKILSVRKWDSAEINWSKQLLNGTNRQSHSDLIYIIAWTGRKVKRQQWICFEIEVNKIWTKENTRKLAFRSIAIKHLRASLLDPISRWTYDLAKIFERFQVGNQVINWWRVSHNSNCIKVSWNWLKDCQLPNETQHHEEEVNRD